MLQHCLSWLVVAPNPKLMIDTKRFGLAWPLKVMLSSKKLFNWAFEAKAELLLSSPAVRGRVGNKEDQIEKAKLEFRENQTTPE